MVDPQDLESVRALLKERKEEIMRKYQALGVAIGKLDPKDPRYAIVVYLESRRAEPEETVLFDGVPLKFEVTGPFKIQPGEH